MATLPKTVRIGPMKYDIKMVGDLHLIDEEGDKRECSGLHSPYLQLIQLNADNPNEYNLATLIHEITHGILESAGQKGEHPEPLVNAIAYGMLDLMRQNPRLIDYIQEQLRA